MTPPDVARRLIFCRMGEALNEQGSPAVKAEGTDEDVRPTETKSEQQKPEHADLMPEEEVLEGDWMRPQVRCRFRDCVVVPPLGLGSLYWVEAASAKQARKHRLHALCFSFRSICMR